MRVEGRPREGNYRITGSYEGSMDVYHEKFALGNVQWRGIIQWRVKLAVEES